MSDRRVGRLVGWSVLVLAIGALNLSARLSGEKPEEDILYEWVTAIGGAIQYAIILGLALAIAAGLRIPAVLGLRRPDSIGRAAWLAAATFAGVYVVLTPLGILLDPGEEQGIVPNFWDGSRAAQFLANALVVAGVAPVVEELLFRGLGFALVERAFGVSAAIAVSAVAFGVWHGLIAGFPIFVVLGGALAWLRARTGSVYPSIVVHVVFNALALILSVTIGDLE